jgi:hypothetical protein
MVCILYHFSFFDRSGRKSFYQSFHVKGLDFLFPYYVAGEFLILGILFVKKLALPWYCYIPVGLLALFFLLDTEMVTNEVKKVISNIIVICFAGYALLMEIKNTQGE